MIHLKGIHAGAIELLELGGIGHSVEGEESQPFSSAGQLEGLLGNFLQHLPPRQVSQIPSVGMGHQELWVVLAYIVEPLNVFLGSLRTWDLFPPVAAIEVLQVFLQGSFPVQLRRKIDGGVNWVVLVTFNLFLQSRVDEVQGCCNQLKEKEENELQVHLSVLFRFWGQILLMKVTHGHTLCGSGISVMLQVSHAENRVARCSRTSFSPFRSA